jgi:hypothetical protein
MLNLTLTMPHPPLGTFSPERREKERDLLRRGTALPGLLFEYSLLWWKVF